MKLMKVTAKELVTTKVNWAESGEVLQDALARMRDEQQRCLLVKREAGQLPGVMTAKDIVGLLGHEPLSVLGELTVGDVMSQPAICLPSDLSITDCINLMRLAGVRRAPVQEGHKIVGMLRLTDIFDYVAKQ